METEKEWNEKILKITLKIRSDYPELTKYLEELPTTIPNREEPMVTLGRLRAYHETLDSLVKKYSSSEAKKDS